MCWVIIKIVVLKCQSTDHHPTVLVLGLANDTRTSMPKNDNHLFETKKACYDHYLFFLIGIRIGLFLQQLCHHRLIVTIHSLQIKPSKHQASYNVFCNYTKAEIKKNNPRKKVEHLMWEAAGGFGQSCAHFASQRGAS
jgi:hypothetical protein